MRVIFGVRFDQHIVHYVSKVQNETWCLLREMSHRNMARMKNTQFRYEDIFWTEWSSSGAYFDGLFLVVDITFRSVLWTRNVQCFWSTRTPNITHIHVTLTCERRRLCSEETFTSSPVVLYRPYTLAVLNSCKEKYFAFSNSQGLENPYARKDGLYQDFSSHGFGLVCPAYSDIRGLMKVSKYGELGHHWLKWCRVACVVPNHYLNQWWLIVNWILRNKLQ